MAPVRYCSFARRHTSTPRRTGLRGFTPTRRAIARIAKEGRKYGVYLGLVTQRPAELDPTIISQCGTLFAMRMSNDRDQVLLRSAVSDAAANLFAFVPSLGTREALAFGAGIPLPTRLTFTELPRNLVPRSEEFASNSGLHVSGRDLNYIASVLERWRSGTVSMDIAKTERPSETTELSTSEAPPVQTAASIARMSDPNRLSLLKRPTVDQPDPYASLRRPEAIEPLTVAATFQSDCGAPMVSNGQRASRVPVRASPLARRPSHASSDRARSASGRRLVSSKFCAAASVFKINRLREIESLHVTDSRSS